MTNAEKFKEVFGFEPDVSHCPKIGKEGCAVCTYAEKPFSKCSADWWNSKYQGEPTIPLSVIEKIELKLQSEISRMEEIEKTCDYKRPHTLDWVLKLIKDEIKEIRNDAT